MAFHDLTTYDKPTMDAKTLLGLGLEFCTQPKGMQWSDTSRMIDRFKMDARLKDYLMSSSFASDDEAPRSRRKTNMETIKGHVPNRGLSGRIRGNDA